MNCLADIEAEHRADAARAYAEKAMTLDPSDLSRMVEQDRILQDYGQGPGMGEAWRCHRGEYGCTLTDSELAIYIIDLRNACKFPMLEGLDMVLRIAEKEARRRLRRPRAAKNEDWQGIDLLAEFRALTGSTGRKSGASYWFSCPFPGHPNGDRHPSLEVTPDKRVWNCHSKHGGGGVVDFLKATGR